LGPFSKQKQRAKSRQIITNINPPTLPATILIILLWLEDGFEVGEVGLGDGPKFRLLQGF
jgi:hypothetical protein